MWLNVLKGPVQSKSMLLCKNVSPQMYQFASCHFHIFSSGKPKMFNKSLKLNNNNKKCGGKTNADFCFRTLCRIFGIFPNFVKSFYFFQNVHKNINFGFPELKIWKWLLANCYIWDETFLESNIDLDWTGPLILCSCAVSLHVLSFTCLILGMYTT